MFAVRGDILFLAISLLYSGSVPSGLEAEPEEETEACEKGVVENASWKTETQNTEDHPDQSLATTPLPLSRFDMLCFCQLR